jgi:hypothetical protein
MWKRCLAIVLVATPVMAFASDGADQTRQPFALCLRTQALALERHGAEIDMVMSQAGHACRAARGNLSAQATAETATDVRLAVMQQRLNARNTRRRG